jgi:lysylphosphatidylglycerol synthetase-like protein (DUF2156 family)
MSVLWVAAAATVVAVIGAYVIYYYMRVVVRNKTQVVVHADASAASTAPNALFPAWLLRGGRRTRLAALLWDEPFRPHPLLLNGHLQTGQKIETSTKSSPLIFVSSCWK